MAMEQGYPYIGLYEGSAIRFQDSMSSKGMSKIPAFKEVVECSGVIPQVAAMMGPCYGRPPIHGLLSEFLIMVKGTGFMGWSGPTLVRGGIGEEIGQEELAGTEMHSKITGLADYVAENDAECMKLIKKFLEFMPSNCWELPPGKHTDDNPDRGCPELLEIVPTNLRRPYDMSKVIESLVDNGKYFEFKKDYGKTIITCLSRLNGMSVGIVANQPNHLGGIIDWDGSYKARRFISICDSFHIPLIFLQDQPGFLIGKKAESMRSILWGGSLIQAVQKSTVPKLTVILRKSHGAAVWAMGGRSGDIPDLLVAWPLAIFTGTGPESAVYTVHDKELKEAGDPESYKNSLEAFYTKEGSIYGAAEVFGIDDIIEPQETRRFLIHGLEMASSKLKRQLGPKNPIYP